MPTTSLVEPDAGDVAERQQDRPVLAEADHLGVERARGRASAISHRLALADAPPRRPRRRRPRAASTRPRSRERRRASVRPRAAQPLDGRGVTAQQPPRARGRAARAGSRRARPRPGLGLHHRVARRDAPASSRTASGARAAGSRRAGPRRRAPPPRPPGSRAASTSRRSRASARARAASSATAPGPAASSRPSTFRATVERERHHLALRAPRAAGPARARRPASAAAARASPSRRPSSAASAASRALARLRLGDDAARLRLGPGDHLADAAVRVVDGGRDDAWRGWARRPSGPSLPGSRPGSIAAAVPRRGPDERRPAVPRGNGGPPDRRSCHSSVGAGGRACAGASAGGSGVPRPAPSGAGRGPPDRIRPRRARPAAGSGGGTASS